MTTLARDGEYCPGSFKKAVKAGSKYVGGRLKYLCPDCGKHYTKDTMGNITKHGYRIVAPPTLHKCFCGQCKKKFEAAEFDYLCEKCRTKQWKT